MKTFGKIRRILVLFIAFVFLQITSEAASKLADIPAGANPAAVAVDATRNKIFVANSSGGSVTVVDGATKLTTLFSVGSGPVDIAVNSANGMVYVVNRDSNNLTVFRADNNSIVTTIPVGDFPLRVAVNPATNRIYVANRVSNNVTVIDGATNTVAATIPVLNAPDSIAVNPVTNKTYVVNRFAGKVSVINGANGVTNIEVGGTPSSVAINQMTNRIYVTNETDNNVSVIDGASDSVVATIATGALPRVAAVNPATNKIYVVSNGGLTVIDGANDSTASVATGLQPAAIAINSATNQIFVANSDGGDVTVVDGATNQTSTVIVGAKPQDIAVNPVTSEVFAVNFESNNITIIEGAENSVSTVNVGSFKRLIAVNPVTNKAYLGNEAGSSMSVIHPDNTATIINTQFDIRDIAVNPITNRIYAIRSDRFIVVINGANDSIITTVPLGLNPLDVEVNTVTNKIYVANFNGGSVTVIDGVTNAATNIPVASGPKDIAINSVTNKIYIASSTAFVSVIDGATNSVTNLDLDGRQAISVAVNMMTNKIFVACGNSLTSLMIDGATNAITELPLTPNVAAFNVEVNPNTNKIYFSSGTINRVSIVDGATLATASFPSSASNSIIQQIKVNPAANKIYFLHPNGVVMEYDEPTGTQKAITVGTTGTVTLSFDLNPLEGKIYLPDRQGNQAFIITKQNRRNVSPTTIAPLADNTTNLPTPIFNFNTAGLAEEVEEKGRMEKQELFNEINSFTLSQITTSPQIYYQVDGITGNWRKASNVNATLPPLAPGLHILYAFAADGQDSTTTNTGNASSPMTGKISAYLFRVVPFSGTQNNNNQITIPNAGGAASPYASVLNVSNVPGVIEKITVRLDRVSHGVPDNLDILLVSPSGEKMILMSDAGGADFALSLTTITFDDAAVSRLPDNDFIGDGAYKPSNFVGGSDTFPAPAPPAPYANPGIENSGAATLNETFGGISPNGAWKLFVVDDIGASSGSIQNWSLTFQTTTICPASNYTISPSSVNLSLAGGTGSISVNAPFGCIWNAASNSSFISISSDFSGIGNGTIDYAVVQAAEPRNGTVTIGGQIFTVFQQIPTAASVMIGGRVLTPEGRGLKNALVTLTAPNGSSRTALTGSFGHYRFADVSVGETYIIGVASKRYRFRPQAVLINEERDDLNLRAH